MRKPNMNIKIKNKVVVISDKNARAYEKLNSSSVDENVVRVYINSAFHVQGADIDKIISQMSNKELSDFVNQNIEAEVRDCGGDQFYEEA